MAHGEAEHGCAQGEPCRPGHHEQPGPGRPHRRVVAAPFAAEPAGRADEDPTLPRQRVAEPALPDPSAPRQRPGEPPAAEETVPPAARRCRSDLAGWAGAHRHGPVRPARRPDRRERPPHRWC